MATLNFDATNVKPIGIAEAIPEGWYTVHMTASEMKPVKTDASSTYLACEYEVLDGEYAGRKVFDNLNLGNKNPAAQEIAYRKLSAICHAVGVIQVADSQQLHNRPLQIKVALRPAQTAEQSQDGKAHDASNEVKGYSSVSEGAPASATPATVTPPPAPAPAAPAAAPAPEGGAPVPPWMRK